MRFKELILKITPFLFPLILVCLSIFLSIKNYTPETWLSGWDTLHPEFDFTLNLKRTFYGVWRQEQGVGALPGHSHMSEIPRIAFLWISSLFLQTQFLRYFYFFVMLSLGPLGVYFFLKYVLQKDRPYLIINLASFLGASYYLLNLGTLQHFYVPFEMFATQFGFMPWLFYLALKYLRQGKKLTLLALFVISFFAAPQAYASTLFYAYLAGLLIFLAGTVLLNRERIDAMTSSAGVNPRFPRLSEDDISAFDSSPKSNSGVFSNAAIKRAIAICLVIFATNAFWLLPNAYSIVKQSKVIENSRINTLFSPEAFLRNAEYGKFGDLILHKNFLFDWREYDESSGQFVDLMDEWNDYLAKPQVIVLGYGLAVMFLVGLGLSLVKKDKIGIMLAAVGAFAAFFLINDNPPTGFLYSYLRDNLGVFREGFRTPFTKFSILFIFVASYFFAYFQAKAFLFLKERSKAILVYVGAALVFGILVLFMKPAFGGNFISKSMRITIPQDYFAVSDWFNARPEGRIAKFPVSSLWGWIYYSWGFEGAGFNWFGVQSPSLDRDFDRWSDGNETFYNQASRAIYSKDLTSLEGILEKFGVRYLLLDDSVLNPGGSQDLTYLSQTRDLIAASEHIRKATKIGSLDIYETDFAAARDYLWTPDKFLKRGAELTYSTQDPIYEKGSVYTEDYGGVVYPFVNYDRRSGLETSIGDEKIRLEKDLKGQGVSNVQLLVPDYPKTEKFLAVEVLAESTAKNTLEVTFSLKSPEIFVNGKKEAGGDFYYQVHPLGLLKSEPAFLSVKDTVFSLEGQKKSLGGVLVAKDEQVGVAAYGKGGQADDVWLSRILVASPRWCSDPDKKVGSSSEEKGRSFGVGPESVCWGEGSYFDQPGLLEVSFESSSATGMAPKFCMSRAGQEGCVNSSVPDSFSKDGIWTKSKFLIPVASGNYWIDFVAQGQQDSPGQISFKNLSITKYPVVSQGIYSIGENFALVSGEEKVDILGDVTSVEVYVPKVTVEAERASLGRGHSRALNCDLKKEGEVEKKVEGERVYYSAKSTAASCDYLDYPKLDHSQAFLFRVRGENVSGRGLKIYLQNMVSNRMDLEELLPPGGKFDESYFVLPVSDGGKGYVFNFETRSFGPSPSANYLDGVEFLNIPYDWLTNLRLVGTGPESQQNFVSIANVKKTGFYKYDAEVTGNGLLVLSQGYEDGWVALANYQLLDHVKVNSWANGWVINNDKCLLTKSESNTQKCNITIVFWPQYLEFIGFELLALSLIYVILTKDVDNGGDSRIE